MEQKINPCPFCGASVTMHASPFAGTWAFICRYCGADVMFYGAEHSKVKAVSKWNRREGHGTIHTETEDN